MLKRGAGGGPLAALRWLTRRFQGGAAAPAPPANNGKSGNFDQSLLPPSPKQLRRDKDVGCHEDGEIRVDPGHSWSTARIFQQKLLNHEIREKNREKAASKS
jgi:hypothetical protein